MHIFCTLLLDIFHIVMDKYMGPCRSFGVWSQLEDLPMEIYSIWSLGGHWSLTVGLVEALYFFFSFLMPCIFLWGGIVSIG